MRFCVHTGVNRFSRSIILDVQIELPDLCHNKLLVTSLNGAIASNNTVHQTSGMAAKFTMLPFSLPSASGCHLVLWLN
jgi:hypothetical protein